jgi:hypothetical protein
MNLISYPFRVDNTGVIATVEDGEEYYAQELAVLIKTEPGERSLVPDYGIADPTFDNFSTTELLSKVGMFGPPVRIEKVSSEFIASDRLAIEVEFTPMSESDPDFPTYGNDEYTEDEDEDYEDEDDLINNEGDDPDIVETTS